MAIEFSLSNNPTFLVPDIKYLIKFVNGDLGIQDKIKTNTVLKNVSSIESIEELNQFKKLMGFDLKGDSQNYIKDGKVSVKSSDIILDKSFDIGGLKAFEKTLLQSIFETQKPYSEVFTQTVGCLVKVEDVIARVLSAGGRSLKPKRNPKALGYKPGRKTDLNIALSKLKSLREVRDTKGLTQSQTNINKDSISSSQILSNPPNGFIYEILSTNYSTGNFDPNYQYTYEYIDMIDDTILESYLSDDGVDILEDEPVDVEKPRVVVFGIFDSKGNTLSDDKIPNWLLTSGKWYGQFDMVSTFKFIWYHPLFGEKRAVASPGAGWRQRTSKDGTPLVIYSNTKDIDYYKKYFNTIIDSELINLDLSSDEKINLIKEINNRVDYKSHVDAVISSGFLPTIKLVSGNLPLNRYPFKPKMIKYKSKEFWIDPEDEYDMKIIKVTPSYKVKYYDKNNKLVDGTINPLSILNNFKKNQVELIGSGKQKILINISQIKNDQLVKNTPYSDGYYGSCDDSNKQDIDNVINYITSLAENKPYYIVEGILEDDNDQSFPIFENGIKLSGRGSKYYKFPKGPISAIGAFIRLLIGIFAKLIPSINKLQRLLTNPSKFVTDSVIKKIGDDNGRENMKFQIFSKKFKNEFDKLESMDPSKRESFVEKSMLRNYVYVDENSTSNDNYKFILDGTSLVKFLSFTFGIGLNKLTPKLTFKSDKIDKNKFLSLSSDEKKNQLTNSKLANNSLLSKLDIPNNQIKTSAGGTTTIEEVSIQYSTGEFIEGVNYNYIYITEYVNNLMIEADELSESDDPESQNLAIAKYELALKEDPGNKIISDKLEKLKNKTSSNTQPLIDFLLNMVTFPLNIIKSVIEYILKFFKSLSSPFSLPSKIVEFISFKWVVDIFKPQNITSIIGLKYDIPQFNSWIKNIKNTPIDKKFDLHKVISMPFMPRLFSPNTEELKELTKTPISMLSSILCLLEAIINSFIDFIWALMGLRSLLPPPYIKLCKDTNSDINTKDFMNILNGGYTDALSFESLTSDNIGEQASYDFAYDIKLPDGRSIRDINYEELKNWVEENKDIRFEFDF